MIWGIIFVIIGVAGLVNTERVRRQPHLLRNGYMVRYTHSVVLMLYTTSQTKEEIRRMLAEDANLRKKYILETYLWCIVCLICGLALIIINI